MLLFAFISGIFIGFVVFMVQDAWIENWRARANKDETVQLSGDTDGPLTWYDNENPWPQSVASDEEWDKWLKSVQTQGGQHVGTLTEEERKHRHQ